VGLSELLPIVVLIALVSLDLWVYADAKAHLERGTPIVFWTQTFSVETPATWFLACLLLSVIFIPLYISMRSRIG
jgi:hypothetical protein